MPFELHFGDEFINPIAGIIADCGGPCLEGGSGLEGKSCAEG
jgi:hypothetical protein